MDMYCLIDNDILFQSTPLREGRQGDVPASDTLTGFNPRPFVRGDATVKPLTYNSTVSIHAPS